MRKVLFITLISAIVLSCNRDDEFENGALSFYPTVVASGAEQDGLTYTMTLNASSTISGTGTAVIGLNLSNSGGVLVTDPPLVDDRITVEFVDTRIATVDIIIENDQIPDDYEAIFTILETSSNLGGIGTGQFTLMVDDTDTAPIYQEDFESGLGDWIIVNDGGSNTWGTTEFNDNTAALVSAFGSSDVGAEDNWLISPEINFDSFDGEQLNFLSKGRFNDEGNRLEVSVLTNFDGQDPGSATKTVLSVTLDPFSGSGFGDFTPSGDIDLSAITGIGHVAFRYKTLSSSDESGWEVDDVLVSIFEPSASNGGSGDVLSLPFDKDFEDCDTDFTIPSGFTEAFASGASSESVWACRGFGVGDSRAVRINASQVQTETIDAWLITNDRLDLDFLSATLSMDVRSPSPSNGNGTLRVYWTDSYFGGDPSFFSWTEITGVTDQLPDKGSNEYVSITADLSAAVGNQIYLAFRFEREVSTSSAIYDIDNLLVEGTNDCNVSISDPVDNITLPYTEDFESGNLDGWNQFNPDGNNEWGPTTFDDNTTALTSGFSSADVASEDNWLISGQIDFDAQTDEVLTFVSKGRFNDEGNELEVYILSSYDGLCDETLRTQLTPDLDPHSGTGFGTFTPSGSVDLSMFTGTGYLAFRFKALNSNDTSGWEIDDIEIQ